jgi:F420H(2)-dependent quinone reductase
VVASNGGGDPPGWFLNLQDDPIVAVQVKADHHTTRARVATAEEPGTAGSSTVNSSEATHQAVAKHASGGKSADGARGGRTLRARAPQGPSNPNSLDAEPPLPRGELAAAALARGAGEVGGVGVRCVVVTVGRTPWATTGWAF